MKKDFIFVLGPQGSGKSTQAKLLAEKLGYRFISTGQIVRGLSESKDPRSIELEKYWKTGALVPDKLIENLLFNELDTVETSGFILDGYPRNLTQIKSFLRFLEIRGWSISKAFYIFVSDEECLKRIKIRVSLENRADENDDAISKRLAIYHNDTEPLLDEYRKMNILTEVDGERSIEEIQKDIRTRFI